jgi:hypothetical protein
LKYKKDVYTNIFVKWVVLSQNKTINLNQLVISTIDNAILQHNLMVHYHTYQPHYILTSINNETKLQNIKSKKLKIYPHQTNSKPSILLMIYSSLIINKFNKNKPYVQ